MVGGASPSHPEDILTRAEAVHNRTLMKSKTVRLAVFRTVTDMIKFHSITIPLRRQYGVPDYHVQKLKGVGQLSEPTYAMTPGRM